MSGMSLADELDPAFAGPDDSLDGSAAPLGLELEEGLSFHSEAHSSPYATPRKHRRGARGVADGDTSLGAEMDSLADELAGLDGGAQDDYDGSATLQQQQGESLGDFGEEEDDLDTSSGQHQHQARAASGKSREEQEEARLALSQKTYEATSSALAESVRLTDEFLSKIRGIASASGSGAGASSSAAASAGGGRSGVAMDDTAGLEAAAMAIVRQLQDFAEQRESQVREMRDMVRQMARGGSTGFGDAATDGVEGAKWTQALGMVDELPDVLEEDEAADKSRHGDGASIDDDPLGFLNPVPPQAVQPSHAVAAGRGDEADEDHHILDPDVHMDVHSPVLPSTPSLQAGLSTSAAASSGPSPHAPASQQLQHLQQCTSELISSLGMLHEHSQVARATMGDAARRLRSLRTVLGQWKSEVESVERSQAWIEAWEGSGSGAGAGAGPEKATTSGAAGTVTKRPEDVKAWTAQQMQRFEKVLADAEVRARELLRPVAAPMLDEALALSEEKAAKAVGASA